MIDRTPMRAAAIPLGWSRDALPAGGSPSRVLGNGGPPLKEGAAGSAGSSPRPASDYARRRRLGAWLFAGVMFAVAVWLLLGIAADVMSEPVPIDRAPVSAPP